MVDIKLENTPLLKVLDAQKLFSRLDRRLIKKIWHGFYGGEGGTKSRLVKQQLCDDELIKASTVCDLWSYLNDEAGM